MSQAIQAGELKPGMKNASFGIAMTQEMQRAGLIVLQLRIQVGEAAAIDVARKPRVSKR